MRYVQLRAFHNVAIFGGFSRAAEALHLTQPAISDQVRKLETEYDLRLFNRGKKQVTLTPSGEKLLEITRRMFEVEDQALELLSESRAIRSGRLSIIADSAHHVTEILARFRQRYPNVFVSVRAGNTESVINSLNSYDADVGVLGEPPVSSEYEVIQLGSTPIVAFAPIDSNYGNLQSMTLKELAKAPLVMREQGSKTRADFEELAKVSGFDLNISIEAEGREAVREIVASGGGVGIVSEGEFGTDSRLVKIRIENSGLSMSEALICLKERQESRLIRTFMDVARKADNNPTSK